MKIWIDGYEANVLERLGSSQVAFELLKNLEKIDHKNEYTILVQSAPLGDLPVPRKGWEYKILNFNRLKTRIALPFAIFRAKQKPDLFFSPTHYIPQFTNVKRIVTVFDLSYLHFPGLFPKKDLWKLKNWTKYSIKNAAHVITISNASKKDIIKQYSLAKEKITVAYPGYNQEVFKKVNDIDAIKQVQKKYGITGQYVIFIGTIQPRKNLSRLIESFEKIHDMKLVIVGKTTGRGRQGWMYEGILEKPKQLGIEDRVIFTGFVPNKELNLLINGATAFVLPSLWEGFGIPVVDSMAAGCPVIVSNVSSLPEVVGSSGLLVDPTSKDQIEQAVRTISTDKKLQTKLSRLSLERVKQFSWEKMAKIVLKVFEEVGNA